MSSLAARSAVKSCRSHSGCGSHRQHSLASFDTSLAGPPSGRPTGELSETVKALERGSETTPSLLSRVLRRCIAQRDIGLGRRVHVVCRTGGHESDAFLANDIIRMYASHGLLQEANDVFTKFDAPDTFVWFSIIQAHAQLGQPRRAIQLYREMQQDSGVQLNNHIYGAVLKACASIADLASGKQVHADVLGSMVEPNMYVDSSLVDMYTKCGSLEDARRVFDSLTQKDVVSWNAMIAGYAQNGLGREALSLYAAMQKEASTPANHVTFASLLKACASIGALQEGKDIHSDIRVRGLEADVFLGGCLMDMYAKCGSLDDAHRVFDAMPTRDVVAWNAMLAGYARRDLTQKCISLYASMQEEGITRPDPVTFLCLLKACASSRVLHQGRHLHSQILQRGLESDLVLGNSIVDMYAKCGSLMDACRVFEELPAKDLVTWNAMITGYCSNGLGHEALSVYARMQQEGVTSADKVTFSSLLKACGSIGALDEGKQLHSRIRDSGLQGDVVISNCLVDMYAKCGSLVDARKMFDGLPSKDVVSWNTMISGYGEHGHGQEAIGLFASMQEEGITPPDRVTFISLLKACGSIGALDAGKALHLKVQENELEGDQVIGNCLVDMYAKCGSLQDASKVFNSLPKKDLVSWNALLSGFVQQGLGMDCLSVYERMEQECVTPADHITFVSVVKACAISGDLHQGMQLHSQIRRQGLEADVSIGNCLVDMYAKCGSMDCAREVFEQLPTKDIVTWNAMIGGYAQHGLGQEALALYARLQQEGKHSANHVTFVCLLKACASSGSLHEGKELHSQIQERELEGDVVIGNCLVDMYAKCGNLEEARRVFDKVSSKDVVTWNSMLAAYAQNGLGQESLALYSSMQKEGVTVADQVTFVCLLKACSRTGALLEGKELHSQIKARGLEGDSVLGNSLVDMYARCGSLKDARRVFDNLPWKDLVTWNAMITGYAQHEQGEEALTLYSKMQQEGITSADSITFACLLKSCASLGAVQQGKQLHSQIRRQGLEADLLMGNCLVDMYAKCGSLEDACRVFQALNTKDVVTWTAMISGYAQHGLGKEAVRCYEDMRAAGIRPDKVTFVSLLSACSHAGLVEKGAEYFESMSKDFDITPEIEHHISMVDLLGRAGRFAEVEAVLSRMPMQPDLATWLCLLAACRKHGNLALADQAFQRAVSLQPTHPATYLVMSHIYADAGLLERANEVLASGQQEGAPKQPGRSWVEHDSELHTFVVGDHLQPRHKQIRDTLVELSWKVSCSHSQHNCQRSKAIA